MAYYLDLFSPETYEIFSKSDQTISGFRKKQLHAARRIQPGDKLICYMTRLSRWIGLLEVESPCYMDEETKIFYQEDDPFVVRFKVKPIAWLEKEKAIPIHEDQVWNTLSFTNGHQKHSSSWTGKFRSSLNLIEEADGQFLERIICAQIAEGNLYKVDENEYRKYLTQRVRRLDKVITVSIPEDAGIEKETRDEVVTRESTKYQAILAEIGEKMGFNIWLPKNDRSRVFQEWKPGAGRLLEMLPLNYDEATLRTIEQIDVLWLKKRSIVRAFEVEHTTSVYSGILRMADLLVQLGGNKSLASGMG